MIAENQGLYDTTTEQKSYLTGGLEALRKMLLNRNNIQTAVTNMTKQHIL